MGMHRNVIPILTTDAALKKRYGLDMTDQVGVEYNSSKCAQEVFDKKQSKGRQCNRNKGYGPSGLYCWSHAQRLIDIKMRLT